MSDDLVQTHTRSISDEVERIGERLREIEQEAAEAERESERGQALESEYKTLKKRQDGLESALSNWGDGEFEIAEMSFGAMMTTKDRVQEVSYEMDVESGEVDGQLKDGFYRIVTLRNGIVDSPNAAPDDPADYPYHVGQWLYDEVDELNTAAGVDAGNLWQ